MVNTETSSSQSSPSVGMDSDGDFVIAWESYVQDGDNYGVYAQRYAVSATEVPTLSEWGLLNLALLLMIAGTLYLLQPDFRRRILEEEG
ncbi:MAG: IPTL-CTERM sorting domain-containing protein [Chitinophagales bacterium]